jgi:hypothetical protein
MPSVLDPPGIRSWDRQRDEPPASFFAFKRWRDTNCTYTQLADELEVSLQTITRWRDDWGWKARKLEFDRYVDSGSVEAAKVTAETLAATHLTAAAQLREAGLRSIRRLLDAAEVDPGAISASAAVRAVDIGSRLERLTLGQPTEITDGPDYSQLSDEEFDALVALQRKAQAHQT